MAPIKIIAWSPLSKNNNSSPQSLSTSGISANSIPRGLQCIALFYPFPSGISPLTQEIQSSLWRSSCRSAAWTRVPISVISTAGSTSSTSAIAQTVSVGVRVSASMGTPYRSRLITRTFLGKFRRTFDACEVLRRRRGATCRQRYAAVSAFAASPAQRWDFFRPLDGGKSTRETL